jgi:hypothetical protein
MPPRRYRAPAGDRAVLADPPLDRWPDLTEANRQLLDTADVTVGRLPLRELRALARREVLAAAREYLPEMGGRSPDAPLVLSGHQPELSHPGVWVKHFALNGLARRLNGIPLNLLADHDTVKSTALRLPTWDDRDPASVRLQSVPFDKFEAEAPYETRGVRDPELFRTFPDRAAPLWANWGYEPLLPRVWTDVLRHPSLVLGERFAAARRTWEREWGCRNLELPVSRLARTDAFARFVGHILDDLPRFREAYNAAVRGYRSANGVRSKNHPVPDLAPGEAPFWGPPGPAGRRGKVTAAVRPADVRPRALTLTLFGRLCLGDLFVHGIGGGKYDEVTDAIIRTYFGIDPPRYAVLSATLHLPVPAFPHTAADVRKLARRERDLYWNPQRHAPDADDLKREKARLAAAEPTGRFERRRWFHDLRAVTDRLRPFVRDQLAEADRDLRRARQEVDANARLMRRDFAWVLYPEAALRPFLQGFL